jgi:hypothetical protein
MHKPEGKLKNGFNKDKENSSEKKHPKRVL